MKYDLNDPAVQKAIEIALETGKYSAVATQIATGKDREWLINFADWLEKNDIISPSKSDNSFRRLKCKTYEEIEAKLNNRK